MHFAQLLVVLSLSLATIHAAPTRPQRKSRSFKIERVRRANYVADGPAAMRKAFTKFGFDGLDLPAVSTPQVLSSSTTTSATGSDEEGEVTNDPTQNDAEFVSPVTVGGQDLVMDFDTGSSDFWVFNTQLPVASQQRHTIFDPSKSTTFNQLTGSVFNITYGDGSFASGPVGTDTVSIGGASVTGQAFGLPTTVSPSFVSDNSSNGLVGLAFSQLNTVRPQQQKTFFDNVMSSLESPVFTANLKHGTAGSYEFGVIDSTQFQGQLSTAQVNSAHGFWEFASPQFAVGSGEPETAKGGSGVAIVDTGTSLMLVDPAVAETYYSQVEGSSMSEEAGGYVFPCSTSLPDLSVAAGNSMATVPGSLMSFAVAGQDQATGLQYCFGGLQSNKGASFQIYGDVFLKGQFVAFTGGAEPILGFAPHA